MITESNKEILDAINYRMDEAKKNEQIKKRDARRKIEDWNESKAIRALYEL